MEIFSRKWAGNDGEESTHVSCEFLENGRLRIEGQDIGPSVEAAWGDDDYEYWMEFSPEDVRKLIPHLLKHVFNSSKPLRFEDVMELAKTNSIEANFDSWA